MKSLTLNQTGIRAKPWVPYVAPMAIYMAFLIVESQWQEGKVFLYPVKTIVVALALIWFRNEYLELRPPRPAQERIRLFTYLLPVAVGLIAIAIWIGTDGLYPRLSELTGGKPSVPFDPTTIDPIVWRYVFIGFRVFGAVVVVSFMEEIFWRGFLIRWIDKTDFKRIPIGTFSWISFGVTVVLFAFEHEEWLAGAACGALYNWLYYKRKDLFSCVIAHAASNAALAAWVLWRGDWKFW